MTYNFLFYNIKLDYPYDNHILIVFGRGRVSAFTHPYNVSYPSIRYRGYNSSNTFISQPYSMAAVAI